MRRHRHAKIVATIGPASSSPERLRELFLAGADVFRLNFSHGAHDDHRQVHAAIRALEGETGRPIAILQDLQGPKIRVGLIKDGKIQVAAGESVRFVLGREEGGREAIPLPHPEIFKAIMPGAALLIDDGRVRLEAVSLEAETIEARVVVGGTISNRKGVNLPDTALDLSPLTAKDRDDLAFGLELGVDFVALSFVQKPADLIEARGLIRGQAALLAKIEKPQALERIEDIVRLADAIMVARGDLGVEIPHEDVPGRQKELVQLCRLQGKPVIVATQMLESMVHGPTPTRAEASDVATAIYDGADAVMLSAESAAGSYPGRGRGDDGADHRPHREPCFLPLDHPCPAPRRRDDRAARGGRGCGRPRRRDRRQRHRGLHLERRHCDARRPPAAPGAGSGVHAQRQRGAPDGAALGHPQHQLAGHAQLRGDGRPRPAQGGRRRIRRAGRPHPRRRRHPVRQIGHDEQFARGRHLKI